MDLIEKYHLCQNNSTVCFTWLLKIFYNKVPFIDNVVTNMNQQ